MRQTLVRFLSTGLILCVAPIGIAPSMAAEAVASIPLAEARAIFDEARALCERDAGKLWGQSLCAPTMLVDPQSHAIVASVRDAGGVLLERDGVFVGRLPTDQNVANTAVEWSGTRWTQMLWPLPEDPRKRAVLIVHESFHNLQPRLGLAPVQAGDNGHLDGFDGRYWLQLEWRALARTLQATDDLARRSAVFDALAFRHERRASSADAKRNEDALELNEGLAEYTGVVVAGLTDEERTKAALRDLDAHVADTSFVRSFAYATGPAYGLLLDRYSSGWRARLGEEASLSAVLAKATGFDDSKAGTHAIAVMAAYDSGQELRKAEAAREQARQERLAHNRKMFVEGPVLTLALKNMSVQFDPRTLQPLDGVGTVYPQLRVTDDWGVLQADGGALMKKDWSAVVVNLPVSGEAPALNGEGWKLDLASGWKLAPDERAGDFVLVKASP